MVLAWRLIAANRKIESLQFRVDRLENVVGVTTTRIAVLEQIQRIPPTLQDASTSIDRWLATRGPGCCKPRSKG
jgi:hypothetical protein